MDIKAKHRIVGIVVLVALAVIFIPLLFTHSNSKETRLSSHVPNPPKQPSIELTIPTVDSASVPATPAPEPTVAPSSSNTVTPQASAADATSAALTTASAEQMSPSGTTNSPTLETPMAAPAPTTQAAPATNPNASTANPATEPGKATEPTRHERKSKTKYTKAKFAAAQYPGKHTHVKTAVVGKAWTIQLASFSEKTNAQKLVKQLRAKGFAAYVNTSKTNQGAMIRVFVGPELKQIKAQQLAAKLHHEFGLKGVVVKYEV